MTRTRFPSDEQDQFVVRLPEGLRDQIRAAAKQSGRSMNSEIIARITGGQANAVRVVTMPTTPDEAEAMEKIGYAWLAANAPERLTDAARERDFVLALYNDLVDRIKATYAAMQKAVPPIDRTEATKTVSPTTSEAKT